MSTDETDLIHARRLSEVRALLHRIAVARRGDSPDVDSIIDGALLVSAMQDPCPPADYPAEP